MSALLSEILEWLDRTSKVSCPGITCEQAREAEELRRLFELVGKRNGQFSAKVTETIQYERERDAERSAANEAIAARHDIEKARDAAIKERDEWQVRASTAEALNAQISERYFDVNSARETAIKERDAAKSKLVDVHDALHRECDGNADLPAEIRAIQKERDALKAEVERLNFHIEQSDEIQKDRDNIK